MAKKTGEEFLEDVKDAATSVVDAAKPVVEKAKKAAKPAAKKAAKASSDAAQAVVETAKKVTPKKPEYYVQFNGREINMEELSAKAKALFREENKRTAVLSCRIYQKPEDNAAY